MPCLCFACRCLRVLTCVSIACSAVWGRLARAGPFSARPKHLYPGKGRTRERAAQWKARRHHSCAATKPPAHRTVQKRHEAHRAARKHFTINGNHWARRFFRPAGDGRAPKLRVRVGSRTAKVHRAQRGNPLCLAQKSTASLKSWN